jgi:hypothetical protein
VLVVICYSDEPPKLVDSSEMTPLMPDGCDGWFVAQLPNGISALCVTPVNKSRPLQEQVTDYLAALVHAECYLRFEQLAGSDRDDVDDKKLLIRIFEEHAKLLENMVIEQAVSQGINRDFLMQIGKTSFVAAHDKCCDDPVCKSDMHKRLYGTRQTS